MKADLFQDTKTRESKDDAAKHDILGNISYAWVDDNPISQTSFDGSAKPSEAPEKSIGGALADEGAAAPKPRLSSVKMCKSAPAGGLLQTG